MDADLTEIADRLALRQLVEDYAQGVDRADPPAVANLFAEDGVLLVPRPPEEMFPTFERRGRPAIEKAMGTIRRHVATMHLIGAHSVTIDGDHADGVTSCLAHHVTRDGDRLVDAVWAIRYEDEYARTDEGWKFASRRLWLDWIEERPVLATREERSADR
jgi:uncharacterized protein (TIGR02246 family)